MQTKHLFQAMGALLMAISQEIHPDARARIRGRTTYMAACMERHGDRETAEACRTLADAIDVAVPCHAEHASPSQHQ